MSEDEKKKAPLWVKILIPVLPAIAGGLVMGIQYITSTISMIEKQHIEVMGRLDRLEEDDAKWGTLAEMENRIRAAEAQMKANSMLLEFLSEVQLRQIPIRVRDEDEKSWWERSLPRQENRPPIELPKIYEQKPVDPDWFREQQQKRYENAPPPKKG